MENGKHLLLAEKPEDFVKAIVRLREDDALWQQLADGGRDFLTEQYDPDIISRRMDDLILAATNHKQAMEKSMQAVCGAGQITAFSEQLMPHRTDTANQAALLYAIELLHPASSARIYFMDPSPEIFVKLRKRWETISAKDIPAPLGNSEGDASNIFDVIAFRNCLSRIQLNTAMENAMQHLFHGGYIVFPVPENREMRQTLFEDMRRTNYQLIFCVPGPDGTGCICARKAIPKNEESDKRW